MTAEEFIMSKRTNIAAAGSSKSILISSLGSVFAGLLASVCCIGPLVFVLLGLSGAAVFAKFEEYRWVFGTLAVGFLVFAFILVYRGGRDCAPGANCAVNPGRRRLNTILLLVSAVLVAAFIFSPNIIGFFLS